MTSEFNSTARPRAVSYHELQRSRPLYRRLRSQARTTTLQMAATFRRQELADDAVHFPFYHWVLDDERSGFEQQLRDLKQLGEVISLDAAVSLLTSPEPIRGRYFCITFDDGFRNNLINAVPILVDLELSAAFFVPTDLIGLDLDDDWEIIGRHYAGATGGYRQYFEYMTWDECRQMHAAGMTVGSHTCGHVRLADLDDAAAEHELDESKRIIEEQLQTPCRHFAAPFGRPGRDYLPERDPEVARRLGYESFLTTYEGPNRQGDTPFEMRRNDVLAAHGPLLFRYLIAHEEPARGADS